MGLISFMCPIRPIGPISPINQWQISTLRIRLINGTNRIGQNLIKISHMP